MDVIATGAGLAVLIIALFAWLRTDMGRMESRLTGRIEEVETRSAARGEEMETRLTARIEDVEARQIARGEEMETRLTARIDGVESHLTTRIDGVERQLTGRSEGLEQGNIDLRERMARIEGMLDGLRDSITGRERRDAA